MKLTRYILFLLLPISIYLFYSWFLKTWIIDDAGISFAYARNLANGNGLTSWPGEKPVEGFSNFLWTLLIALLHVLRLFDPIISPKIMAFIFITGSFIIVQRTLYQNTGSHLSGLAANLFIAINAPLIIWCNSGLENSLYIFLLLLLIIQIVQQFQQKTKSIFWLSTICFLISVTRPEGILYFWAFPLVNIFVSKNIRKNWKQIGVYGIIFFLQFGGFLMFRWFYFHDWVPNPFYAKYNKIFSEINLLDKLDYFTFGIGGRWGKWMLIVIVLIILFLKTKGHNFYMIWKTVIVVWCISIIQFFVLPADWMGELRFASIFIVSSYLVLILEVIILINNFAKRSDLKKIIAASGLTLLLVYSGYHFFIRINDFSKDPTIPFAMVKSTFPDRFNQVNQQMGWKNATILLPDVGATLYYSEIKVIDAAGLSDRNISKKIAAGENELRDYVFEELKPSIIHLHGRWKKMYGLQNDKRLFRDYYDVSLGIPGASSEFYPFGTCDLIRKDMINATNKAVFDRVFDDCVQIELQSRKIDLAEEAPDVER